MKSSAVLVNTARGPIVDERALVDALGRGVIAGAALDVFEFEPDVSDELRSMDQVVLTPHIGSGTASHTRSDGNARSRRPQERADPRPGAAERGRLTRQT